ncbi:MAG: DUF6164 family protein [Dokdonella sp.]
MKRHLLLNLRHVPEDESAEIRALLALHEIAFYETEANRWGISAGAIWIRQEGEVDRARELLANYQIERQMRARAEFAAAKREGRVESFWQQIRREPLRLVMILFTIAIFIALSLWPLLLAG